MKDPFDCLDVIRKELGTFEIKGPCYGGRP